MLDIYQDNTTLLNHTLATHMFCIVLRTLIGINIINNNISKSVLTGLCIIVLVVFGIKYIKLPNVWKVYSRTLFIYALILTLMYTRNYKYTYLEQNDFNKLAGSIIIVDAIMAIQSRHIFDRISLLL